MGKHGDKNANKAGASNEKSKPAPKGSSLNNIPFNANAPLDKMGPDFDRQIRENGGKYDNSPEA